MALGKRLVAEYGLDSEVDTLGRWLVHHIAELIRDAEDATSADIADRRAAAVNAILKFWEHRRSLDRIDPLRDLRPMLSVIRTLNPDENRWRVHTGDGSPALCDLYSAVRQIIVFLLLDKAPSAQVEQSKFLSDEEAEIIGALNIWLAEYQKEALKTKPKPRPRKRQVKANDFDPKAYVLSEIDDARQALDALEREVRGLTPIPKPNPYELLINERLPQIRIIKVPSNEDQDDNSEL
ncbi:hypothetical protein [Rhizobium leguminosarum]|uniref:hypothetical protein n=1 Tax=Rhizobium leguminosarum TaxID=384 RepID=UPI003F966F0E